MSDEDPTRADDSEPEHAVPERSDAGVAAVPEDGGADAAPRASEMIGAALGSAARKAGLDPANGADTGHVVWRAMGGWRGILESVLPGLVFVVTYTVTYSPDTGVGNLVLSLGLSVGLAAIFTIVRLVQRGPASAAIGGLLATAAAAALALWTGRGEDNFVFGFFTNGIYGLVLLASALIGWPLIGLAVGFLMNEGIAWRTDRRKRRVFFWLTIAWAAMFALRLAVQLPFYFAGDVTVLGTLKLAMGLPLFAPLVAVTWLAVRALYRTEQRP